MSNLFLRAALVGCAAAAAAVAQTPVPPVPTQPVPPPIAIPAPVPTVTYIARVPSPAQGKMILKTFDVADLVCPSADCPLAKPGTDPAMTAAAKAFTEVRAEELIKAVKTGTDRGWWDEYGGGGKLAVTTDGKSLVVNHTAAVVDKVGACVESVRKLRSAQVKVDMVLFTVSSKNEAMAKLLGDKPHAAVKADEMNVLLRELKASGQADILSRPTMIMLNKQTGFCQVGEAVPLPQAGQVMTHLPVGTTTRVTPDVSADLKSVALAFEYEHRATFGGPLPGVNSCVGKANMVLPDGGTMVVRVVTRKVEQKTECKVPVVGDLPYVGRLFRNVAVCTEPVDTVAVVSVNRVHDCPPVAPPAMAWTVTPPTPAPVPVMLPTPPVALTRATVSPMTPTATPVPAPVALPAPVSGTALYPNPVALPPARPQPPTLVSPHPVPTVRTIGPDGLERVGVNFDTLTVPAAVPPVSSWVPAGIRVEARPGVQLYRVLTADTAPSVAGGCIGTAIGRTCDTDDTASMMAAYKAACAAGKKEEASRLALQLLAKDPTCFGK